MSIFNRLFGKKEENFTKSSNINRERLKENYKEGLNKDYKELEFEEIIYGNVTGNLYKPKESSKRGVVILPGFSDNRFTMQVLVARLVENGIYCLSIDPPSHHKNSATYTLGEYSEEANQAILFLKNLGINSVGLIGHSMGGVAALLSISGYSIELEESIYIKWDEITSCIEKFSELSSADNLPKEDLNSLDRKSVV